MKPENLITRKEMKEICVFEDLRKHRDEVCYSQDYMANQSGIHQATYQRMEAGEIKVSASRLAKIAAIFGKPVEAFLTHFKNKTEGINGEKSITVSEKEWALMQQITQQQEKLIEELEAKIIRRNIKIDALKQQCGLV